MAKKTKADALADMRKTLADTIANERLDGAARFQARRTLARLDMVETIAARTPKDRRFDFTDESLGANERLDLLAVFMARNAIDSATWPKMDEDERQRLINAAATLAERVSSIQDDVATHPAKNSVQGDLLRALVAAWEIGMFGNAPKSAETHVQAMQVGTAHRGRSEAHNKEPSTIIMKRVVDQRYQSGDEEHPDRFARAMCDDVNRAFEATGLEIVKDRTLAARISRYIKTKNGKAKSSRSSRA